MKQDDNITLKLSKQEFITFRQELIKASWDNQVDADKTFMMLWIIYSLMKKLMGRLSLSNANRLKLNLGEMAAIRALFKNYIDKYSIESYEQVVISQIVSQIDQKLA